ncbi:MAG: hypothetical protein ACJAZW_001328 [Maritalea sp.]|jgi:hypothetical protein
MWTLGSQLRARAAHAGPGETGVTIADAEYDGCWGGPRTYLASPDLIRGLVAMNTPPPLIPPHRGGGKHFLCRCRVLVQ